MAKKKQGRSLKNKRKRKINIPKEVKLLKAAYNNFYQRMNKIIKEEDKVIKKLKKKVDQKKIKDISKQIDKL